MNIAHPHAIAAVVAGLFGLVLGSFVGVVADRVPRKESIIRPGSHCTSCGTPLRPLDNIPLISYLVLRGRCHSCGVRIPPRDLYVELATAVLFAGVAWRLPTFWALPAYCVLAAGLVALSVIDLQHKLLPKPIVYITAASAGVLVVLASPISHRLVDLAVAGIGAATCFVVFLAIWFVAPRAMGFGDVRLAGLCGGALGWLSGGAIAVGMLAAFLLAGVPAVAMLVTGKADRKTALAFGPYLALGTMVGVCFGPTIAHAWVSV
ncbi:MAG: prepilin peptidase [Acidimicrobiales bacterium]|jgi:leader peptidase (prepilin peptidase)/N-methyltransferase